MRTGDTDDADPGSENAMRDQLRKDVAAWTAARADESHGPAIKTASPPAAPVRRKVKVAPPVEPVEPVAAPRQPYKMSYGGVSNREYVAQRLKLGAR